MQSEGGAAGAVHGALQAGAMTTTFTASQGLLLMIPNMYKIAGELTSFCMHVSARTLATHALSIFGDHSDVMACRQTGFALLASNTVQEAHDFACIAQAASLRSRIPFLHFFDGFRTSHEVNNVEELTDDELRHMIADDLVAAHRARALSPDHPVIRGTAQNPDVFFQAREACNGYYDRCPDVVLQEMERFAALTGRRYQPFDYVGHPEAERVVILMGSGAATAEETVRHLAAAGERVGMIKVRLYRPFDMAAFLSALPATTKGIAVLDRTKEPGSVGEPLFMDVLTALHEARTGGIDVACPDDPTVIGGRYGLSSKEFTPAMVKAVLDELSAPAPRRRFTVGIVDDVTHMSLDFDETFDIEPDDVVRGVFFGLGSDGTVGANKNSIKIISEQAGLRGQGYFVYDSKKAGAMTVSHLRFGPRPIESTYLIREAGFVACHHEPFLERVGVLRYARAGGTFLLNSDRGADEVWDSLPLEVQRQIIEKQLHFWVIDAVKVAREAGMGRRINTVMQTCFFKLSGVLPEDEAIRHIKDAIQKTYAKKGEEVVKRNFAAVDDALAHLHEVEVPAAATTERTMPAAVPEGAPDFVQRVTSMMMSDQGDLLPVSAFPVDGTWPMGTTRWEKRNIAHEIPLWDSKICIQCNKCTLVCPHAAIRAKIYSPDTLEGAPEDFLSVDFRSKDLPDLKYTLQVAPEDCTGCNLCVTICPAKDKANPRHKAINMEAQAPVRERERDNYDFFLDIPEFDRSLLKLDAKHTQFMEPLFEYSGACAGCGETPYVKLLTQLFGDRMLIANATGCSSIYGGNLPTTPYCTNDAGRGPAWSNSLFEDNAEFGLGFRLAIDQSGRLARELVGGLAGQLGDELVDGLLKSSQETDADLDEQRGRVEVLRERLTSIDAAQARHLEAVADYLVRKSVWIVGGDGWAYDIGYGGLDHVMSLGRDVNILVLDTEVYSNTGGQQSKATPLGAAAKFAAAGKGTAKKDLGMMAMAYGNVYVAQIAFGSNERQTVNALLEADAYPGPSIVIAYSHCIAHGYDLAMGVDQQKRAVSSGYWPLFRFDPRRVPEGQVPLSLDSRQPKIPISEFTRNETRFRMVERRDPARFRELMERAQRHVDNRFGMYEYLSHMTVAGAGTKAEEE
jgi:pyruvate-ferredoxin/flavodoxin oxidoreductase